jgi:hypothetical protein
MFTKNIKSLVSLTKSGVRWLNSSPSDWFKTPSLPSIELKVSDFKWKDVTQQDEILKNATPEQRIDLLNKIQRLTWGTSDNIKWRESIKSKIINLNVAYTPLAPSVVAQKAWVTMNAPTSEALAVKQTAKIAEVISGNEQAKVAIATTTQVETSNVKKEVIYDQPLVKKYAQRINLWSAIAFVNTQSGESYSAKLTSAIDVLKKSGIIYAAQSTEASKSLSNYIFREELADVKIQNPDRNAKRAIEADSLLGFLEWLQKLDNPKKTVILNSGLTSDEKVDISKLGDLIADFDDDGILESINGTDTTTWWKWLVTKFGAGDAMQTQFFSESDMKTFLVRNMPEIQKYFEGIGIRQWEGEKQEDYAKRLRSAITIQADMLKTGYIGENGMKNIYSSSENRAERQTIEKVLTEVKSALKGKNIAPADLQKVSEKVTDMILRTALTFGGGSINLQEISKLVSDPEKAGVIGMDYSAFLRLINRPRLKIDGTAWVGAGIIDGWFIPLAHIGASAKVTVADRADIENLMQNIEKGDANMTATLGASLVTKLSGPAIHADLLWKDRIDQTENAGLHLRAVINDMMTLDAQGNPSLAMSKLEGKKMDQSLRDYINLLNSAIEEGTKSLNTPAEKQAHAVLMKNRFLNAFDLYLHNHPKLNGVGLAGITIGLVPGALGVGAVLQNVWVDRTAKRLGETSASSTPIWVDPVFDTQTKRMDVQSWKIDSVKQKLIQNLDIDKLFGDKNVTGFLQAMTNKGENPNRNDAFKSAIKVPAFAQILGGKGTVYSPSIHDLLLDEIDEKFVGDQITRGYNNAKTDPKAFADYMKLLKSKGIKTQGIKMENMTPELIADASFNKPKVRKDELKLLMMATEIDTSVLDAKMITSLKAQTTPLVSKDTSALVLMARSRKWSWLQWVRAYTSGSYLMEESIATATPQQKLKTLEKALGGKSELETLVKVTLEKSNITLKEWQLIKFDPKNWIATVETTEKGKITINLSATTLSAVLYGDTTMEGGKAQAVCVNAGIKIDPKITIKSELSTPTPIDVTPGAGERVSDVVFSGTPIDSTLRLMISVPQGSGVNSGKDPNGSSDAVDKGAPVVDSNASQV